jgi:hypothetical protein
MARTVVATPQALEGIDAAPDQEILLAADKAAMLAAVMRALDHASLGDAARAKVLRDFDWAANLARVDELLER